MSQSERRLAAIMFTDMVGYTALTQSDESLALEVLDRHNRLLRPFFPKFQGREVKAIGDSFLVEFDSALDATNCAIEIQRYLHDYNISSRDDWKINLRIGIHLGDVTHSGGDVLGDAVNIASRLQPLAESEGICVSDQVFGQVRNKIPQSLVKLAQQDLKNVHFPVDVYKVVMPWDRETEKMPALNQHRVAVLPFVNMSPDPQDEFFADGLTEELIDRLCQVRGLEVIARTSVMGYKKKDTKAAEIGKELRVGALVEGSVRKAGNRIRVTAQLINANTEGHLWSSKYDRDFQDIFSVQTDIAEQVASALEVQLLPSEKKAIEQKRTENMEAYSLYLKGKFYTNERNPESLRKGIQYFEKAIEKDPEFALAHVGVADCYGILEDYGVIEPEGAYAKAMPHLERALRLGDGQSEAHASLANLKQHKWDWSGAEAEYRQAIKLNPNYATAHQWYSIMLALLGRKEEALEEIWTALSLDPTSPIVNVNVGMRLAEAGRVEEGIEHLRKTLAVEPNFGIAHAHLGSMLVGVSRYEEAIAEIKRAIELQGSQSWPRTLLCYAYGINGDREKASKVLSELEEMSKTVFVPDALLGTCYFALGDIEKAISFLERAYEKRSGALLYTGIFLAYKEMHRDNRINAILNKPFS